MELAVVGAGVGRTGTHSLKLALEQLLDAPCHHMLEILGDPSQVPAWIDAIEGRPVNWSAMLARYRAIVDWPGGAFWRELSDANPDALVLLSVRDPESWYRSASNTIFLTFENMPAEVKPWMDEVRKLLHDRFSDRFDDPTAMMDAFVRHNDTVRAEVPAGRLLEWATGRRLGTDLRTARAPRPRRTVPRHQHHERVPRNHRHPTTHLNRPVLRARNGAPIVHAELPRTAPIGTNACASR